MVVISMTMRISIHVPAWGTTWKAYYSAQQAVISIHVPAWGTTLCSTYKNTRGIFQSTFPRGERQSPLPKITWIFNFNPRSRVGNDRVPVCSQFQVHKFQSTFPRGERQQISTIFHLYICISSPNLHFSITSF